MTSSGCPKMGVLILCDHHVRCEYIGFKTQRDYCDDDKKKRLKLILNLLEFLFYGTCKYSLVLKVYESTVGGMILKTRKREPGSWISSYQREYKYWYKKYLLNCSNFQLPRTNNKNEYWYFHLLAHVYMYLINQPKNKSNCINQHTTLPHQLGRRLIHLEI